MKRLFLILLSLAPLTSFSQHGLDSLFQAFHRASEPALKSEIAFQLGKGMFAIKQPDSSIFFFRQILEEPNISASPTMKASSAYWLGHIYRSQNEYSSAILAYSNTLSLYEQLGDKHSIAITHWNLGEALIHISSFPKANYHFEQAESIFLANGYPNNSYMFFQDIGFCMLKQGLTNKALYHLERAIENNVDDLLRKSQVYNLVGECHRKVGNFEQAKKYYEASQTIATEIESVESIFIPRTNMALLFMESGRLDTAKLHLIKIINGIESFNYPVLEFQTKFNLAKLYWEEGRNAQALSMIKDAFALVESIADKSDLVPALALGVRIAEALGKHELHDQWLRQLMAETVPRYVVDTQNQDIIQQSTVAEGLLSQENQRLSSQLQEATQESEFGQSFIAGLAMLFGLIGFMLWHQRHKQLKLSQAETARLQAALLQKEAYMAEQQDKVAQQTASLHDVYRQMVAPNRDQAND